MALPMLKESYSGKVNEVQIGAKADEGGTRTSVITVGGEQALPYLDFDGTTGRGTVIAMDVMDIEPETWPEELRKPYKGVLGDPAAWARKCVDEFGADLICVKLDGIDPDGAHKSAADAVAAVDAVRKAVGVPLIVWGCGNDDKDNEVMPRISQLLKGERALLGVVQQDNYRTLTAVCMADGHSLIALAPLDINIAKQVNVLVSDMDFPLGRIVMFQTTGALGYGLEYAYSIQERERLAALGGDKMMAMPVICDVGHEAWRAKEAKLPDAEAPQWGPQAERGPLWEAITGVCLLQSGADILRMNHPKAVAVVKKAIAALQK